MRDIAIALEVRKRDEIKIKKNRDKSDININTCQNYTTYNYSEQVNQNSNCENSKTRKDRILIRKS